MPADDAEPDPLVDAMVQSAFATMAVLNRAAAENDLSLTQLRVLGILRDRRLRMAQLAGYLGLEKSTARGYGAGWHASLAQLTDHLAGAPVRAWDQLYAAAVSLYATD